MVFKVCQSTSDDVIEDIYRSILTNIADIMGMLVTESTFGAMSANDQRTDEFYIVKFLSTVYMLQHYEIVDNELLKSGTLVSNAEYTSPGMKGSMWYVKSGIGSVKINMEKQLVSNFDVDIVTSTLKLDYSMSNISQEDAIEKETFTLSVDDYENTLHEISRRESIGFEIGGSNEIETVKI
eukprot:91689-Ditylum_brightwellii.AAC.1